MSEGYGLFMMQREVTDGQERARIIQADDTALISPILIGQAFTGESPYLRIHNGLLTISDDFDQAVTYQLGQYVMGMGEAGFELRRDDRHHYETHVWSPDAIGDEECVACGVTWTGCLDVCPERSAVAATAPLSDAQGERTDGDGTAVQDSVQGDTGGKR